MNIGIGTILWGDVILSVGSFVAGAIFGPALWAKAKALIGAS